MTTFAYIITYFQDGLLKVIEAHHTGERWIDREGAPWGAIPIVAIHETKSSAEAALERAKVTEKLLREPWQRAVEHAMHLEAYMREGVRLACLPTEVSE